MSPPSNRKLKAALREELEALGFCRDLPLSVDFDAEREINSSLICGYATHEDFGPLQARHFAGAAYGAIFDITKDTTDVVNVVAQLRERGYVGAIEGHVAWVADGIPAYSLANLRQKAAMLVELWRHRTLRECMSRVDALLAIRQLDADGAFEEWRKAVQEVRA